MLGVDIDFFWHIGQVIGCLEHLSVFSKCICMSVITFGRSHILKCVPWDILGYIYVSVRIQGSASTIICHLITAVKQS